ncbi:hypothetical protein [Haladaptatus sp. DFWS20]|uniref:hypothetical protein n=1 Tax=Haladaptatus sp. DFWS20 TaxID=3403467 RepID=UPI003EBA36FF
MADHLSGGATALVVTRASKRSLPFGVSTRTVVCVHIAVGWVGCCVVASLVVGAVVAVCVACVICLSSSQRSH